MNGTLDENMGCAVRVGVALTALPGTTVDGETKPTCTKKVSSQIIKQLLNDDDESFFRFAAIWLFPTCFTAFHSGTLKQNDGE